MQIKRLSAQYQERKLDLKYIGLRNDETFKQFINLKQNINRIIRNININLELNNLTSENLQRLEKVNKNNIILQYFEELKKKFNENQQLLIELISEGFGKKDFNYLLDFWEKIRKNLSKFTAYQKIFSLIKEIDKNVKNIESKIELFKGENLKIKVPKEENKIYNRVHINKINKINNNINKNFLRSSTKVDEPLNKKLYQMKN